jgi:hypothetical protein
MNKKKNLKMELVDFNGMLQRVKKMGLRVRVWVILYLFEHTRKDFQTEILLVS